jgi:hypothetical protein
MNKELIHVDESKKLIPALLLEEPAFPLRSILVKLLAHRVLERPPVARWSVASITLAE